MPRPSRVELLMDGQLVDGVAARGSTCCSYSRFAIFGLNNSRGVKLLWLCLPANSQASCTLCPLLLLLPTPAASRLQTIGIFSPARLPLHLHELPRLLSLFRLTLSLSLCLTPPLSLSHSLPIAVSVPHLLLSDCPQKAAQQKIEFPVRTDSIWRCNFTLCYCKVAATAGARTPHQEQQQQPHSTWPAMSENSNFTVRNKTREAKKKKK